MPQASRQLAVATLRRLWRRPDVHAKTETPESLLQPEADSGKDGEPYRPPSRTGAWEDEADRSDDTQPSGPGRMELRLMMEVKQGSSSGRTIEVDGTFWTLSEPIPDIESETPTPYICVSYVWGSRRVPNPVHPSISMSDRTLRTFAAVARSFPGKPIWIDAFCVPVERMAKRATLESLGFIFSRAEAVVVVLSPESIAAIEYMRVFMATKPRPLVVPDTPLAALDADEWIRSVWTYQETANSQVSWFISEAREGAAALAFRDEHALNFVGAYMNQWEEMPDKPVMGMRHVYPYADNFQELLLDLQLRAYTYRSALQIMYGMNRRASADPANQFYSMIGALTQNPSSRATKPTIELLAERFMELCEEKGDYSFIFCAAPRDTRPGLRWRPIPCMFPIILAGHVSEGEGLPGKRVNGGVLLSNVLVLSVAREDHCSTVLPSKLKTYIRDRWLAMAAPHHGISTDGPDETLAQTVYECLKRSIFSGEGGWYTSELGIFYPQTELSGDGEVRLCVVLEISWRFGAPALASFTDREGERRYVPGILVGWIRDVGRERREEFLLT
ncbi:hypothetical protein C8Q70DRAFT_932173 [Cubamyces menziesii]|nr:hypothetical protein C8Q70DRAFT_932173 [Cubamyces menziesii]